MALKTEVKPEIVLGISEKTFTEKVKETFAVLSDRAAIRLQDFTSAVSDPDSSKSKNGEEIKNIIKSMMEKKTGLKFKEEAISTFAKAVSNKQLIYSLEKCTKADKLYKDFIAAAPKQKATNIEKIAPDDVLMVCLEDKAAKEKCGIGVIFEIGNLIFVPLQAIEITLESGDVQNPEDVLQSVYTLFTRAYENINRIALCEVIGPAGGKYTFGAVFMHTKDAKEEITFPNGYKIKIDLT